MSDTIDLPNKAYLLPDAIPNWPPAWSFWVVLTVFLLVVVVATTATVLRYRHRAYRREALQHLKDIVTGTDSELVEGCITLIKRCLITEGHEKLVSCTTKELLPILDQQMKRAHFSFTAFESLITEGLYCPNKRLTEKQRSDLVQLTSHWIRKHHA